jgi:hypothetical protein
MNDSHNKYTFKVNDYKIARPVLLITIGGRPISSTSLEDLGFNGSDSFLEIVKRNRFYSFNTKKIFF